MILSQIKNISLRKFPYPYKAALTICSDIDGTSLENFIEIHKFLNTNKNTVLGRGLEIPIGDSFWMYDNPNITEHAFSYFKETTGNLSNAAPVIRDFIKCGILDVMHSYGNFATEKDFSRRLAEMALEELSKQGLKIFVWTNHGGEESVQNIGKNSIGKGDINSIENQHIYHADLLMKYGMLFYWDTETSLMSTVGQDCPARFGETYWRSPLFSGYRNRIKCIIKGMLEITRRISGYGGNSRVNLNSIFKSVNNRLILSDTLRDSNNLYQFKRFGHGRYDWFDDLPFLLSKSVFQKLLNNNGYLILYIHIGDRKNRKDNMPLSPQSVQTLRQIAELYHLGDLWIAPTSQILKYNLISAALNWEVSETSDTILITINGINSSPVKYDLKTKDLSGLTFAVPQDKPVNILFYNEIIPYQENPIDDGQLKSITIPLQKIEWPF